MAETQRSVATLLTNLADNTAGDISAEDVRDVLVSSMSVRGELYNYNFTSGSQVLNNSTFNKINHWQTVGENTGMTPSTATDDITVDIDGDYFVIATLNILSAPTDDITFQVFYDGSAMANINATKIHVNLSEFTEISLSGIVPNCVATKKIDIRGRTATTNVAIQLQDGNFSAMMIG